MTRAFRRRVMGNSLPGIPSRFLGDIPRELIASPEAQSSRAQATGAARTGSRALAGDLDGIGGATDPGPPPFSPGDRVSHGTFGEGVVVNCKPTKDDYELTVAFDGSGVKRLLHSLAKLQPGT